MMIDAQPPGTFAGLHKREPATRLLFCLGCSRSRQPLRKKGSAGRANVKPKMRRAAGARRGNVHVVRRAFSNRAGEIWWSG